MDGEPVLSYLDYVFIKCQGTRVISFLSEGGLFVHHNQVLWEWIASVAMD